MVSTRENIEIPSDISRAIGLFRDQYPNYVLLRSGGVIILNKPPGIAMSNSSAFYSESLVGLAESFENTPLKPVNRLDRDTSGVVILATTRGEARSLCRQFQEKTVKKTYLALVQGCYPLELAGIIAPIRKPEKSENSNQVEISLEASSKFAQTGFRRLALMQSDKGDFVSLVKVRIYTGRKHQIRVHAAELGFPIIGDSVYNDRPAESRQMLHSSTTSLMLPGDTYRTLITAPLPDDFRDFISKQTLLSGYLNLQRLMV